MCFGGGCEPLSIAADLEFLKAKYTAFDLSQLGRSQIYNLLFAEPYN